jgi:hypothetical protein
MNLMDFGDNFGVQKKINEFKAIQLLKTSRPFKPFQGSIGILGGCSVSSRIVLNVLQVIVIGRNVTPVG